MIFERFPILLSCMLMRPPSCIFWIMFDGRIISHRRPQVVPRWPRLLYSHWQNHNLI